MRKELCIKLTAPNQCTECGRLFGLYYIGTDRYWCVYCGSEGRIYRVVSEEDLMNYTKKGIASILRRTVIMDKSAVRKVVSGWLKETKLEEGEQFATFPDENGITIRILNAEGTYRSDYSSNTLPALPLKEKRKGVYYEKCPNCGKKGMRDACYVMKPLERAMSLFSIGGKICKYCGYAEYLEPKEGKMELKNTKYQTKKDTEARLKKQREEQKNEI